MSEEALWYAARVAGLMTWVLAFGSLSAGLLVRTKTEGQTPADQWAADTHRFLGACSFLALLVHGGALVAGDRSDLSTVAVLSGYQGGSWLPAAVLVGVICAWMLVLVELGRAVAGSGRARSANVSGSLEAITTLFALAVVVGGAYHAWIVGSDTRNVITLIVAGLAAAVLVATAAVGALTIFSAGDEPQDAEDAEAEAPDRLGAGADAKSGVERSLGSWSVSTNAPPIRESPSRSAPDGAKPEGSQPERSEQDRFNPQLTVSLSRQIGRPAPPHHPSRAPHVSSARDIPTADGEALESASPPPPQHRRR